MFSGISVVSIALLFLLFSSNLLLDILIDEFSLDPNKTEKCKMYKKMFYRILLGYVAKIINYKYGGRKPALCC